MIKIGAFKKLFNKYVLKKQIGTFFEMLNGYIPAFTNYDGGVYEMELTRACIHTFANHCTKLLPNVTGADLHGIKKLLDGKPNFLMTSSQFLYKVATIYETQNTCFIVPVLDEYEEIVGYYPVLPQTTELVEYGDAPYLKYSFANGQDAAIELERVGIVSKYLYRDDLYGEKNTALNQTLQLINTQNEGISENIKNSASFRFMATVNNFTKYEDLVKERQDFVENTFGKKGGVMALFPNTWTNVQQIKSNPEAIDPEQMKIIETRVFDYFGCNEEILQNKGSGEVWAGYYEGKIEPFALQLSQAMTMMTYTAAEISRNNGIVWSSNRLQYMSNADKLQASSQMFDRGIYSINDVMDIWNMPHVEGGDKRYIRREYVEISKLHESGNEPDDNNNEEDDSIDTEK